MKLFKTLLLTLFTFLIVSCNSNNESSNSNWTKEEQNIMKEHLHGLVIPYIEFSNYKVSYDEEYQSVLIECGRASQTKLLKAAEAFYNASWDGEYEDTDSIFTFLTSLTLEEGTRYIEADIYAYNKMTGTVNYNGEGTMFIEIYDPYYYSWPIDLCAEIVSFLTDDNQTIIPSLEADYYEYSNFFYDEYNVVSLYAYTSDTSKVSAYALSLEDLGWEVESDEDEYMAISPFEDIVMYIAYAEDAVEIDIGYHLKTYDAWQGDKIKEYLPSFVQDDIPSFEEENNGFIYSFSEIMNDIYPYIIIYTEDTSTSLISYQETLLDSGYTLEGTNNYGDNIYISPNREIKLVVYESTNNQEQYLEIEYLFYYDDDIFPLNTLTNWANYVGAEDVIFPSYTLKEHSTISISFEENIEDSAYGYRYFTIQVRGNILTDYLDLLADEGFTCEVDDSKNITFYYGYSEDNLIYYELYNDIFSMFTFISFYVNADLPEVNS